MRGVFLGVSLQGVLLGVFLPGISFCGVFLGDSLCSAFPSIFMSGVFLTVSFSGVLLGVVLRGVFVGVSLRGVFLGVFLRLMGLFFSFSACFPIFSGVTSLTGVHSSDPDGVTQRRLCLSGVNTFEGAILCGVVVLLGVTVLPKVRALTPVVCFPNAAFPDIPAMPGETLCGEIPLRRGVFGVARVFRGLNSVTVVLSAVTLVPEVTVLHRLGFAGEADLRGVFASRGVAILRGVNIFRGAVDFDDRGVTLRGVTLFRVWHRGGVAFVVLVISAMMLHSSSSLGVVQTASINKENSLKRYGRFRPGHLPVSRADQLENLGATCAVAVLTMCVFHKLKTTFWTLSL